MKNDKTRFSFIVISRSEAEILPALQSLRKLASGVGEYEVLLATGNCPSVQRNRAAQMTSGEYLVFLDNDSEADPALLRYYNDALALSSRVAVVGGPSCLKPSDNQLSNCIHAVFSSEFGLGPFRSRYMSLGPVRSATESDLILCNLCVRKEVFLAENGFNEKLYPNEENEFLNRLRDRYEIIYHPLAIVYRQQRKTIKEFLQQMIRYGRGRVKAYLLRPHYFDVIFFVPLVFALYVIGLGVSLALGLRVPPILWLPSLVYLLLAVCASGGSAWSRRAPMDLLRLPPLFALCHFWYGVGLVLGIFGSLVPEQREELVCEIRRIDL